jgi:hypothetical protein
MPGGNLRTVFLPYFSQIAAANGPSGAVAKELHLARRFYTLQTKRVCSGGLDTANRVPIFYCNLSLGEK